MPNAEEFLKAWVKANTAIQEINTILGVLNTTLAILDVSDVDKLHIRTYLLQVLDVTKSYIESVRSIKEQLDNHLQAMREEK